MKMFNNSAYACSVKCFNELVGGFCDSDLLLLWSTSEPHEKQISICLYLSLHSWGGLLSATCADWLHVSLSAHSHPGSWTAVTPPPGFSAAPRTERTLAAIPGRINAQLNWINIIQTCSIPARLSCATRTVIPAEKEAARKQTQTSDGRRETRF